MARPRKSAAQKIRDNLARGKTINAIASQAGCSRRYVMQTIWIERHKKKVRTANAAYMRAARAGRKAARAAA
jgi:hypothetical protein